MIVCRANVDRYIYIQASILRIFYGNQISELGINEPCWCWWVFLVPPSQTKTQIPGYTRPFCRQSLATNPGIRRNNVILRHICRSNHHEKASKTKGTKQSVKPSPGPDLSFRTEKTSLHDKYSSTKAINGDKKQRTGSDENKRESNGLSLPELRKTDGIVV